MLNMSALPSVLLLGSSGRVGSAIKAALLKNKERFSKIGVVESATSYASPDKALVWTCLKEQGFEVVQLNLADKSAMVQAFRGIITSLPQLAILRS
jgi:uncharacterized protein YbjT (DUF2867 family)